MNSRHAWDSETIALRPQCRMLGWLGSSVFNAQIKCHAFVKLFTVYRASLCLHRAYLFFFLSLSIKNHILRYTVEEKKEIWWFVKVFWSVTELELQIRSSALTVVLFNIPHNFINGIYIAWKVNASSQVRILVTSQEQDKDHYCVRVKHKAKSSVPPWGLIKQITDMERHYFCLKDRSTWWVTYQ